MARKYLIYDAFGADDENTVVLETASLCYCRRATDGEMVFIAMY